MAAALATAAALSVTGETAVALLTSFQNGLYAGVAERRDADPGNDDG